MRPALRRLVAHARVQAPWRRALPHRAVYRDVQGTGLWLPWSHRLPDYVAISPGYGRNLVEFATRVAAGRADAPLHVIDVGANIGDSTKQIIERIDARVLAIEADPYYLDYLRRNVGDRPNVTIAPLLLITDSDPELSWHSSRRGGTTQFTPGTAHESADAIVVAQRDDGAGVPAARVAGLPERYPDFANVDLIKSDTDGHDTSLVPELASVFAASRPALFFEFDPPLTRAIAERDAQLVWGELADLGYRRVGLWGNDGAALRVVDIDEAAVVAAELLASSAPGRAYLDAAVVHADDDGGLQALDAAFGDPIPGEHR